MLINVKEENEKTKPAAFDIYEGVWALIWECYIEEEAVRSSSSRAEAADQSHELNVATSVLISKGVSIPR